MSLLLHLLLAAASLSYLLLGLRTVASLHRLKRTEEQPAPIPECWPTLSIIVPACNEAQTLRAAMHSLLAQDYPNLEIVLVNDRSSDSTGIIADELAREDSRLTVIHLETLPPGWLGKVHALHVGSTRARGEWTLFTDADVHFAPQTMKRAVAVALWAQVSHLAMLPKLVSAGFLLETVIDASGAAFFQSTRAHLIEDPSTDAYVGVGAFNLVETAMLTKAGGLEWIALEVADDVALGLLLKRGGAKSMLLLASNFVSVEWYPTLQSMVKGLEKTLFAVVGGFSAWKALTRAAAFLALGAGPLISVLAAWWVPPWVPAFGALALGSTWWTALALRQRLNQRLGPALGLPLGFLMLALMTVRSTALALSRQAIEWRGTRYPLSSLKAGQRVKL